MNQTEMKEKCEKCNNSRIYGSCSSNRYNFLCCSHEPYKGKWCSEIKECPKEGLADESSIKISRSEK